jgi:hypothetical protein
MLIGSTRTSTLDQEAGLEAQKRDPLPRTATIPAWLDEPGYEWQNGAGIRGRTRASVRIEKRVHAADA